MNCMSIYLWNQITQLFFGKNSYNKYPIEQSKYAEKIMSCYYICPKCELLNLRPGIKEIEE